MNTIRTGRTNQRPSSGTLKKRSSSAPPRKKKELPPWDGTINNLNQYKLTAKEQQQRKQSLQSKHIEEAREEIRSKNSPTHYSEEDEQEYSEGIQYFAPEDFSHHQPHYDPNYDQQQWNWDQQYQQHYADYNDESPRANIHTNVEMSPPRVAQEDEYEYRGVGLTNEERQRITPIVERQKMRLQPTPMPEPKGYAVHDDPPSPYESTQATNKDFGGIDLQHFVQTLKEDRKGTGTIKGNKVTKTVQPKVTKRPDLMKQIQTDNQYIDEMDKRYKEITTQVKKFEQQRVSEKPTAFYGTNTKSRGPSTTDFDETLRVLDVFAAQITELQRELREERELNNQYQNQLSQQGNSIDLLTQRLDQLEQDKMLLMHQKEDLEQEFNNYRKETSQEIKIIQKDLQALMMQKAHENLLSIISTVPGQGLDFDSMYKSKQSTIYEPQTTVRPSMMETQRTAKNETTALSETIQDNNKLVSNRTMTSHVDQLGQTLTQPTTKDLLDKQQILESTFYMTSQEPKRVERVQRVSEQEEVPRQPTIKNMFANGAPVSITTEPRRVTKKTIVNNTAIRKPPTKAESISLRAFTQQ